MYDTLHITVKCFDSNKTLDTVIFYDSLAGGSWVGIDTLTAKDSAKGGLYTTKKIDSLKAGRRRSCLSLFVTVYLRC